MKKVLDTQTLQFNILQPILVVFVLFFIISLFASFYFESFLMENTEQNMIYFIILLFILIVSLFLVIKFYINKFSKKIVHTYKENLKELTFNEHYLKALEDTSPNLIISAIGKDIEKVNKSFLEFTEFKNLKSFHKKHTCISELFVKKDGYLSPNINDDHWLNYVITRPNILHKAIMVKDNKEYIFIVNARNLNIDNHNRTMSTFIDITEFENLQKRFELAITGTNDGLWDWNLTTDKLFFSPQWKKMLGYEDHELKDVLETWQTRVHPDDLEKALFDIQQNVEGKTTKYENIHRLKHKNGSWVWILDRGQTIFDENNKAIRMIGFHSDITEKTLIEQELHNKDEMMIAQSKNAAMGEMISMIAHQWRQPLNVIAMGANNIKTDVALDMIEAESLEEMTTEIINQTNHLSKTIDDFKDFFQPKDKKETVLIHDVFDDALNMIGKALEDDKIELIKKFQSKKKIDTYSRELMQVILNILKNSQEALLKNETSNKNITIITQDYENNVLIEICDNAGGIEESALSQVFNPYFTTKEANTGTGLGLYMSKIIVEKHLHGKITACNNPNGACFTILIYDEIME